MESDAPWEALVALLGRPHWARHPSLASLAGRRTGHDAIDERLRAWLAARGVHEAVAALLGAEVSAAPLAGPRLASACPQHAARGFFESVAHPVTSTQPVPTVPFRHSGVPRWVQPPAPRLGQHGRAILAGLAGASARPRSTPAR